MGLPRTLQKKAYFGLVVVVVVVSSCAIPGYVVSHCCRRR